jgi:hypothetical protein
MHFSKTYTELLLTLPPDLRNNAIEYRQVTIPSLSEYCALTDGSLVKKTSQPDCSRVSGIGA